MTPKKLLMKLFTYTKISHSRRIYGKNEEKKNIDKEDIVNGFKMFMDNRKESKLDSIVKKRNVSPLEARPPVVNEPKIYRTRVAACVYQSS